LLSAGTGATLLRDADGEAGDVLLDRAVTDPAAEGGAAEGPGALHATRAATSRAAASRLPVHRGRMWEMFTSRRSQGFDETTMRVGVAGRRGRTRQ
jgi:hypothetical protein